MIKNCPFSQLRRGFAHPILPIRIINPHTNQSIRNYGLIDTGADECAIPAGYAMILGHELLEGTVKNVSTGNGITQAYAHTTTFEVYDPRTNAVVFTIEEAPVDFMPNLHVVLLGVKSFLSRFVLTIDYPQEIFSLEIP